MSSATNASRPEQPRPDGYVWNHMRATFADHVLEEVPLGDEAQRLGYRVFRLHRPGTGCYRVQITFSPEGIALQGDVAHGLCTATAGYGLKWFSKRPHLTQGYLCSKFLTKRWQQDAATRDLDYWVGEAKRQLAKERADQEEGVPESHTDFVSIAKKDLTVWKKIRAAFRNDSSQHTLYAHGDEHFCDFWDYGVGDDYPLGDAGWLCAVQERFAELHVPGESHLTADTPGHKV